MIMRMLRRKNYREKSLPRKSLPVLAGWVLLLLVPLAQALEALSDEEMEGVSGQGMYVSYFERDYAGCTLTGRFGFGEILSVPESCHTGSDGVWDGLAGAGGATLTAAQADARIANYQSTPGDWQSYRLSMDAVIKLVAQIKATRVGGYRQDDGIFTVGLDDNATDQNRGPEPYGDGFGWDLVGDNIRFGGIDCPYIRNLPGGVPIAGYCGNRDGVLGPGPAGQLPHEYYDDAQFVPRSAIYSTDCDQHDGNFLLAAPDCDYRTLYDVSDNASAANFDLDDPGDERPFDPLVLENPYMEIMFAPECELFGQDCTVANNRSVFAGLRAGAEKVSGNLTLQLGGGSGYISLQPAGTTYMRCAIAALGLDLCASVPLIDSGSNREDGFVMALVGGLLADQLSGLQIWGNRRGSLDSIQISIISGGSGDAIGDLLGDIVGGLVPPIGDIVTTVGLQEAAGVWVSLVRDDLQWPGQGYVECFYPDDPDGCDVDPIAASGGNGGAPGWNALSNNRDSRGWNLHINGGWAHGGTNIEEYGLLGLADIALTILL